LLVATATTKDMVQALAALTLPTASAKANTTKAAW